MSFVRARQNRQRGKANQKAIAELFGALDIGTLGGEDGFHKTFSIEAKSKTACVLFTWMQQADDNNKHKRIPMLVVRQKGRRAENAIVSLKFKDFIKLFEDAIDKGAVVKRKKIEK